MEGDSGRFDGMIEQLGGAVLRRRYTDEIERAVANLKRDGFGKWFRREWYRAGAKRRWSDVRKARRKRLNYHPASGIVPG